MSSGKDNAPPKGELRLAQHAPAVRVCLRCEKRFSSKGPGNRICGRCAVKPPATSRAEENVATDIRKRGGQ